MAIVPGSRVGAYEIASAIGAGGMGEVYRARDTRLARDVAIKVVSESVSRDPARVARFQSEAQLLAALNHPHIATIHGLEESDSGQFLVMELVDGETLADRLKSGPLPVNEALGIARQIADALQAAHEKGIIHRDLKPANIALTSNGQVKVLDFGLAKMLDSAASGDISLSPTMSLAFTQAGMILGTAAYMAPEQARGKPADKRSDIWAFGCVLYEMLTGKRAFDGEDAAVVLASVIKSEPDWPALPADTPAAVVTLLHGCVEKDSHSRVADIAAAAFVLNHTDQLMERVPAAVSPPVPVRRSRWRRVAPTLTAVVASALTAAAAVWLLTRPLPPAVIRTVLTTSGSSALVVQGADRDLAITPDGSRVVYRGANTLFVRALDQIDPIALNGLGAMPRGVFTSPDGQWVGYFDAGGILKKVAITGGAPLTIAVTRGGARGATWAEDNTVVFATSVTDTGLQRVSANGGEPVVLTKPHPERGEFDHVWPEFLPGGKAVLFTVAPTTGGLDNAQIAVLDLRTNTWKVLIRGGAHAQYSRTGHLVYGASGTLRAVPFDLRRLEVTGSPVTILQGVQSTTTGAVDAALSANGSLVYVPGTASRGGRQTVVALDRQGHPSPLSDIPSDAYRDVRVSPDGKRVALATQDDVWIYDIGRGTLSRLTTDAASDTRPLWTPDGKRIIFTSSRAGYPELFWKAADGTGADERIITRAKDLADLRATGWSPDGKQLLFGEVSAGVIRCSVAQSAIDRPSEVKTLVSNEFCNDFSALSPDGRWLAYHSNLSGRYEVYIERYPQLGGRQQISTSGGWRPMWARDGHELFFSTPDNRQLFSVSVQSGATLIAGRPRALFDLGTLAPGGGTRPYDVAPDGRFFVIRPAAGDNGAAPAPNAVLVQNWGQELRRVVLAN
jgi:serine/threonine-protein kinase